MNKYLIMGLGSLGILSLFATAFFPMLNFTLHFSSDKAAIIPYQGAILLTALSGFFSFALFILFVVSMILFILEKVKKNSNK